MTTTTKQTDWTTKCAHEAWCEAEDNGNKKLAQLIMDTYAALDDGPAELDEQDLGWLMELLNENGHDELAATLKAELDAAYGEAYDGPTGPAADEMTNLLNENIELREEVFVLQDKAAKLHAEARSLWRRNESLKRQIAAYEDTVRTLTNLLNMKDERK